VAFSPILEENVTGELVALFVHIQGVILYSSFHVLYMQVCRKIIWANYSKAVSK